MGNPLSKCTHSKVEPVDGPIYSKALLRHVQKLIDEENAAKRRSVKVQTEHSFLRNLRKRTATPSWFTYDIDLDGNVVKDGMKVRCPAKLEKVQNLPVLTLDMLLEKQEAAERKRIKELEKRRKATSKSLDFKQRQEFEELERQAKITEMVERQRVKLAKAAEKRQALLDERRKAARSSVEVRVKDKDAESEVKRQAKIIRLSLKQSRAEANRKEQLQLIQARATNALHNAKTKVVEAKREAKAKRTAKRTESKLKQASANKARAVRRVVREQQIRETHAKQVRARIEQQLREEEEIDEFDREWNRIEGDENYCVSDNEEDTRW